MTGIAGLGLLAKRVVQQQARLVRPVRGGGHQEPADPAKYGKFLLPHVADSHKKVAYVRSRPPFLATRHSPTTLCHLLPRVQARGHFSFRMFGNQFLSSSQLPLLLMPVRLCPCSFCVDACGTGHGDNVLVLDFLPRLPRPAPPSGLSPVGPLGARPRAAEPRFGAQRADVCCAACFAGAS